MGISGVHQSASLDMLKQALLLQQNMSQTMLASMQQPQTGQTAQNDGDGDHGVEPGKGQHINTRA